MDPMSAIQGGVILVQLIMGSLGNLTILFAYLHIRVTETLLKPVDVMVSHLAIVNFISLVANGIPQVMTSLGLNGIFNNAGCKCIMYFYRVTRALSVSTTCTLSVFQAITIAPLTSSWGKFKHRIHKYIVPSFMVLWIINVVTYCIIPIYTAAPQNNTLLTNVVNKGFCYFPRFRPFSAEAILSRIFMFGTDVVLMIVMVLASGYILLILKRHNQQVQYIHIKHNNKKMVAEQAADTIIKLVALYIFFYGIDVCIITYTSEAKSYSEFLSDIRVLFLSCYPCLSPLIVSRLNKKVQFALIGGKKDSIVSGTSPNGLSIS